MVPSEYFKFSHSLNNSREIFVSEWDTLKLDLYMADSGSYRLRRYGVFEMNQVSLQLTYQSNATFYQSLETNPVNGGINRKFAPLLESTIENRFLHALIRLDFKILSSSIARKDKSWRIGVHQIKIRSFPGSPGSPTPEGVHRDDEAQSAGDYGRPPSPAGSA